MNKLCYEEETTNKTAYIVFTIFMLFVVFVMGIQNGFEFKDKFELYGTVGALGGFAAFVYLVLYLSDRSKIKIRKEYENIKNNGKKVVGTIIKYNHHRPATKDSSFYYTVTVEYQNPNTNQIVQYETPRLSFDACENLGSKTCSVYVLDDKVYITDFVEKTEGLNSIWDQELQAEDPESYKGLQELKKREMRKATIGIILFFLAWLAIVYFGFFHRP